MDQRKLARAAVLEAVKDLNIATELLMQINENNVAGILNGNALILLDAIALLED